jgi:uncharacterized membrane protein (UPF0127 family)
MRSAVLKNQTRGEVAAERVRVCQGFWDRLRGLLGTKTLPENEACWLIPCNSVHTMGMRYPIDVYFLNRDNEIVSMIENMAPNRFSPLVLKAHSAVEFKSGAKRNLKVGDRLLREMSTVGQTTVEFCMGLAIFVVLFMAIADMTKIGYNWMALQYSSNRGIRSAKMMPGVMDSEEKAERIRESVQTYAQNMGMTLDIENIIVDINGNTIYVESFKSVTLSPLVGMLAAFGGGNGGTYTLRTKEIIRNDEL